MNEPAVEQAGERRDAHVESLRALAALSVLLFHVLWFATGRTADASEYGLVTRALLSSRCGVFLFFALSGYLLMRPFARAATDRERVDLARYARNRALRILPLYFLALAILLPLAVDRPETSGDWWRFALFAQNYSDATLFRADGPMWSLVIEVQFYVLLPVLAALLSRTLGAELRRWAIALVALAVASWVLRELTAYQPAFSSLRQRWLVSFPTNFAFFVPGMLLALADVRRPRARGRPLAWFAAAGASWAAAIVLWPNQRGFDATALVASFALLAGVVAAARGARGVGAVDWLTWRPLALLGVASYSLYVWHQPIILWLTQRAGLGRSLPLDLAIIAPLCIAVAALSYQLFERPFLLLRRRWQPRNLILS